FQAGTGVERVSMPLLEHVAGFLFISGNPALEALELPSFVHADYRALTIRGNPSLPQCAVEEIAARLDPPVESLTLDGNLGTCD
ncbi:MAG TPA: hypothetical protein VEQ58_16050, partial [Polyangiaceae bacterium]|nr:hypothetical protein [Polyangiaceae bacterium]